ncbi:MAG TPA: endolytic transglycosylase MltG, partial [Methylovirgula sp.]
MEDKSPDDHDGLTYEPSDEGSNSGSMLRRRFLGKKESPDPEPPSLQPRRKRRPTLSALSGFLSVLLLLAFAGLFGVVWGAKRLHDPGPLTADKTLYIAPGSDYPDIVAQLESENVIDNPLVFNVAVMSSGKRSKIKAGEYLFKQNASMRDVIDTLIGGKQVLHSITVPEGLTSEQIVARLQQNDILLGEVRQMPKEGSLLPETYKVPRGMSRNEVLRRMHEDQTKLVEQIWAHRAPDLILKSPYELVTLASIVEKETGKAEERPHVAAVFLNRLQKHIRLQSDPTIVYGLVQGKGTLGRPIQHAEVLQPTPYNTYVIDGLPPGPITNPGRAALEAVANPMKSADLYFVADGTGGHVFSATLEQHSKNVQHWREIVKAAKEKANDGDVDRVVPLAPVMGPSLKPAPKPHRRSDLDDDNGTAIYGALPGPVTGTNTASAAPSLGTNAAAQQLANIGS